MNFFLFETDLARCLCEIIEMGMIPSVIRKESISPSSHVVNFLRLVMGAILLSKVILREF
jgi:hypothetical protein